MFLLESPRRGDSNKYTQYTIFNKKKKITLNYPILQLWDFFQETPKRVRNSRDKRAILVQLLKVYCFCCFYFFTIICIMLNETDRWYLWCTDTSIVVSRPCLMLKCNVMTFSSPRFKSAKRSYPAGSKVLYGHI